jgi:hypothetical protein
MTQMKTDDRREIQIPQIAQISGEMRKRILSSVQSISLCDSSVSPSVSIRVICGKKIGGSEDKTGRGF